MKIRQNGNFKKVKELGHFLKGSSAQLGLKKVQLSSQRIQELQEDNENVKHLGALIQSLKTYYADTSAVLISFYNL
jgi:HPt (histidine-containing phosphotransfer) domain-containing protein